MTPTALTYFVDETAELMLSVADPDTGEPHDADQTPVVKVRKPDGTTVTVQSVSKTATGEYLATYTVAAAGQHWHDWQFAVHGAVVVVERRFEAIARRVT